MTTAEAIELAVHRALRGEVPPNVRAIMAMRLASDLVELRVFHHGPASELGDFEEVVESELQMCLPAEFTASPRLRCEFVDAETYEVPAGELIIYNNPWASRVPSGS